MITCQDCQWYRGRTLVFLRTRGYVWRCTMGHLCSENKPPCIDYHNQPHSWWQRLKERLCRR